MRALSPRPVPRPALAPVAAPTLAAVSEPILAPALAPVLAPVQARGLPRPSSCSLRRGLPGVLPPVLAALCSACSPGDQNQAGPQAPLAPMTAYHLYVSSDGDDDNPGTAALPFLSIERAAQAAFPDTTIHVAPGNYPGGFKTSANGSAKARIYYISSKPGAARIVPPAVSANTTAWDNRGNYVDIVGFEIDGSIDQGGTKWLNGLYSAGSFDSLRHNVVHHIANSVPCTTADGAGITIESYYKGVEAEVIGNKVYDIGPPGCAAVQGITINTSALVANNLVFRSGNAGIYLWHDANHVRVIDNTVTGSSIGILVGGGDFYFTAGPNDYSVISNNIVFDNKSGIVETGATGKHNSYRNNLVFANPTADWRLANRLAPTATVAADPAFLSYRRDGIPDFRLGKASPAIGKGDPQHAHPVDFNGDARSAASGIDLGALQHQ